MQSFNPEAHTQNDQGLTPAHDGCAQPQQNGADAALGSGERPPLVYNIRIAGVPPEGVSLGIRTDDAALGGQGIVVKLGLNAHAQVPENSQYGYSAPVLLPSAHDWGYAEGSYAEDQGAGFAGADLAYANAGYTYAGFASDVFTDETDEAGLDACFSSQLSEDSAPIARFAPQGYDGMFAEDEATESWFTEARIAANNPAGSQPLEAEQPEASQSQPPQPSSHQADTQEPQSEPQIVEPKKSKVGDILFYLFLIALVVGSFVLFGGSGNGPRMIAGYSAFTVTTGSMHDVLPQGSLIVTKQVDPETLQVGDDITYMTSETTSITHRIVGIEEEYEATGERAFKTKGTMNKNPDSKMVPAGNVVGKVVFCSPALGTAVGFIQHNWPLLIFLAMIAGGLTIALKRILQ